MRHRPSSIRLSLLLCLVAAVYPGQQVIAAGPPVVQRFSPPGGTRGSEFTIKLTGENLIDSAELLFYRPGLAVTKIVPGTDARAETLVTLKVTEDCPLGEHPFRLRTPGGLSDLFTLRVGPYTDIAEAEPNQNPSKAQKVPRSATVTGTITELDVDCFAIEAKRGERLSAEVEGLRLGPDLFDPHVSIVNSRGEILSERDDAPLLRLDTFASIKVPEDGTYFVLVRESALGGSADSVYRLHVGSFPRPSACFPAGGQVGEELTVRYIGDPLGELVDTIELPANPGDAFPAFPGDESGATPSPHLLRVSLFPNALEHEPNDRPAEVTEFVSAPIALNGILATPGDVDCFRVRLKGGETLDIDVFGQRINSPIDSVLRVLDSEGHVVVENDDTQLHDSRVRLHVPADGDYFVQIEDHRRRGGPEFVYRVEIQSPSPRLTLNIPEVERHSQQRQTIAIPQGGRYAALIAVQRQNISGAVDLIASELPEGVTMKAQPIPAHQHLALAVFEATDKAPLAGALIDLRGVLESDVSISPVPSRFEQRVGVVTGRREVFRETTVDRVALAVTQAAPFKLTLEQPTAAVVQDGRIGLRVRIERQSGFDKPVRLQLPLQPPYLERPDEEAAPVEIAAGETETIYPLIATPEAPIDTWPIAVLGRAETPDGIVWTSSNFVTLSVTEPYVRLSVNPAETEAGQSATVVCDLETLVPFDGEAVIKLSGLPKGTSAPERKIDRNTRNVTFPVTVTDATPVGIHNALFCEITIVGQSVNQFVGRGGELDVRARGTPPREKQSRLTVLRRERDARNRAAANSTGK